MKADEESVRTIAHDVWRSLTGLELDRRRDQAISTASATLTATIRVEGTWKGVVAIRCPFALGRIIASRMCSRDVSNIQESLVSDSLGEIANIVAAKLKRWLPGGALLSMPQVLGWKSQTPVAPDCDLLRHVAARCDGYPVDVLVYAHRGAGRGLSIPPRAPEKAQSILPRALDKAPAAVPSPGAQSAPRRPGSG